MTARPEGFIPEDSGKKTISSGTARVYGVNAQINIPESVSKLEWKILMNTANPIN